MDMTIFYLVKWRQIYVEGSQETVDNPEPETSKPNIGEKAENWYWTDIQTTSHIGITIHFVDNYIINSGLLAFLNWMAHISIHCLQINIILCRMVHIKSKYSYCCHSHKWSSNYDKSYRFSIWQKTSDYIFCSCIKSCSPASHVKCSWI